MNDMTTLLPHIKLRFTIEHPSFEECYAYGYECALANLNEADNPYRQDSKESEHWLEGWWAGFYGETPLYELADPETSQSMDSPSDAANDQVYYENASLFFAKVMEITGMLAVSAVVGYQVIDLLVA